MENKKISNLQRAVIILEFIAEQGMATASEIIEHASIPKSSGYMLLNEMQHLRLISQDNSGKYRLWLRLVALGERASEQLDVREASRTHL